MSLDDQDQPVLPTAYDPSGDEQTGAGAMQNPGNTPGYLGPVLEQLGQRLFPPAQANPPAAAPALPTTEQGDLQQGPRATGSERAQSQFGADAYLSRQDASSSDIWDKGYATQKAKYTDATPAQLNTLTVHNMPTQHAQFQATQYLADQWDGAAHEARAAITSPPDGKIDPAKVVAAFNKMFSFSPTGEEVRAKYVQDGLYKFTVASADGKKPQNFTFNINQLHDLGNIGKFGQFDGMADHTVATIFAGLERDPGTAPPVAKKEEEDKDPSADDGTAMGRYTKSEQDLLAKSKLNAFGMPSMQPLTGTGKSDVDFLEKLRQKRVEPEQELEKAQAGQEGKLQVAKAQGEAAAGRNANTVNQRREAATNLKTYRDANMARLGASAEESNIVKMYDTAMQAGDHSNAQLMQAGERITSHYMGGGQGDQGTQETAAPTAPQGGTQPVATPPGAAKKNYGPIRADHLDAMPVGAVVGKLTKGADGKWH